MIQLDIFQGIQNRDAAIARAVEHADNEHPKWSELAYRFLLSYRGRKVFLIEDVRKAAEGIVPEPPSQRAWGGVAARAVRAGRLQRVGFANVKNAKAHCTPASVWRIIK